MAGAAKLALGGPLATAFDAAGGDVLVPPSGTGHRRAAADAAFTVVGAYPRGRERYDLLRATTRPRSPPPASPSPPCPAPDEDPVGGPGVAGRR